MSGFLLDTNVISEFNRRGEPDRLVKQWLEAADTDSLYISKWRGPVLQVRGPPRWARKSRRPEQVRAILALRLRQFVGSNNGKFILTKIA